MYIKEIEIENYRNITHAKITPAEGLNVFYGDNGQGKTNLLEGVSLFAFGRSFRGVKDSELIRIGSGNGAGLKMTAEGTNGARKLEIRYAADGRRSCKKNGIGVRSLSEFVGNFRAVLFATPQLGLVRDAPAVRRSFLDAAISQLKPVYLASLVRFRQLLMQRNRLLKQLHDEGGSDPSRSRASLYDTLDLWTLQLAAESAYISSVRYNYLKSLLPCAANVVREMSGGGETLGLSLPEPPDRDELMKRFRSLYPAEIARAATLCGAHRDDLSVFLDGRDAKSYASQGQQRTIALALKLAEGQLCEDLTRDPPVYLLDDVLSELDSGRRSYVLQRISGRQVLLTACEGSISGKVFHVRGGVIEERREE